MLAWPEKFAAGVKVTRVPSTETVPCAAGTVAVTERVPPVSTSAIRSLTSMVTAVSSLV